MKPPPLDLESCLQRHGQALRALAGELVRDPVAADDAVQEVWLAALQRPPRHHGSLGGWLATALHNVARVWHRKERRRAVHEGERAARAALSTADDRDGASREQRAHDLLRAVEGLEPAQRDAVWQRYFEGRPPRVIAAVSGVPVATVKSRLQRALGTLRARLEQEEERDGGGDWRAGFAMAFGLREHAAAGVGAGGGTAVTALAAGGVLMATWTKVAAAAVAVIAVAAWWCWPDAARSEPLAGGAGGHAPVPVAAASAPSAAADASATPAPPSGDAPRQAAPAVVTPDPALATVRGRCVDAAGNAVTGCTVSLRGWLGRADRAQEWLPEHGSEPVQLEQQVAADGTFAFRFVPPPYVFQLWIDGEAWARASRSLSSIERGADVDAGDFVMVPGATLRGRVVDAAGIDVADVQVDAKRTSTASRGEGDYAAARTRADGSFAFSFALPLGDYELRVGDDHTVQEPQSLRLDRPGLHDVRVVAAQSDLPSIRGTVVDGDGRPVAWADVGAVDERGQPVARAQSRRDGTFTVRCRLGDPAAKVRLVAGGDGTRDAVPGEPVAWGARDVTLRVPVRATLTVFVADAHGAPLAGCTVRLGPEDSSRWSLGGPSNVARTGADGTVRFQASAPGRHVVIAEFAKSRGLRPRIEPVTLDGRAQRVEVRVGIEVARRIRVVDGAGEPSAGTLVQLCEPSADAGPAPVEVLAPGEWFASATGGTRKVLVFEQGHTDRDGALVLHGMPGRALSLRVLGPGHVPAERDDLQFGVDGEYVVTVAHGARVRGKVEPPEAVAELKRLAGQSKPGHAPQDHRARVQLLSGRTRLPGNVHYGSITPDLERFVLAPDGAFDVSGLPPGTWDVAIAYWERSESMSRSHRFELGTHQLTEGALLDLHADLTALLPGTVRGLVLCDGAPYAEAMLAVDFPPAPDGSTPTACFVKTDSEGRFELTTKPGTYTLRHGREGGVATPELVVTRGEVTEQTFGLPSGAVLLRLVTADGLPAGDVGVHLERGRRAEVRTAADGTARLVLSPGDVALFALPRRMQQRERDEPQFLRSESQPAPADWIELGTTTVTAGRTTPLELRLPADWAK
jgi:RNA polymerase sigma-70 factor (ECF subfamily)